MRVYSHFDKDGDGKISYHDFAQAIGPEIHPGETLYFRQDKPQIVNQKKCMEYQCWSATIGQTQYCTLHNKMHQDSVQKFYLKLYFSNKEKWQDFISEVKKVTSPEDNHFLINMAQFETLCLQKLGHGLTLDEKNTLYNTTGRIVNG